MPPLSKPFPLKLFLFAIGGLCLVLVAFIFVFSSSPRNFRDGTLVRVEKNTTLTSIANELYADHIIRSPLFFRVAITLMRDKKRITAGDYFFDKEENLWTVMSRMITNDQGLQSVRVTFPEGLTALQMADILDTVFGPFSTSSSMMTSSTTLSQFNKSQFLSLASTSEGYLFPDTYLFLPNVTASTVVSAMKNNFNQKIQSIAPQISAFSASGHSLSDIVIMASIVEKEATSTADRRIIAGILWKRLDAGDLLQVDPPIIYAKMLAGEKISRDGSLTLADLATTSPYNTYKYKGLPPTPIDNPSFDAIESTLTPTSSNYWFYLSDSRGAMHYSVTYDGQLANEAKYLTN